MAMRTDSEKIHKLLKIITESKLKYMTGMN